MKIIFHLLNILQANMSDTKPCGSDCYYNIDKIENEGECIEESKCVGYYKINDSNYCNKIECTLRDVKDECFIEYEDPPCYIQPGEGDKKCGNNCPSHYNIVTSNGDSNNECTLMSCEKRTV
jgi:hypothetical protein